MCIGWTWKLRKPQKRSFSVLKPYRNILVLSQFCLTFLVIFKYWIKTAVKISGKKQICEIFDFLILGVEKSQKLGNRWNFHFSSYIISELLSQFIFYRFYVLITTTQILFFSSFFPYLSFAKTLHSLFIIVRYNSKVFARTCRRRLSYHQVVLYKYLHL